ncbi:MAG: alpha/beta fold hydrolase [Deltaproteobacteria bacterium]|nr:alpha/beta fold hydrolase [Deltaproteobacteria bacterium]
MMTLSELTDPVSLARKLGVFDAVPNAMARFNGAVALTRANLAGEPAPVAPSPFSVVAGLGGSRLLRYEPRVARRFREPVLITPSVINRPYILDLVDGNSVVQDLLDAGYAVYLIDWGAPGEAEEAAGFDTYVYERLRTFAEAACADAGAEKLHLFAQCLGGTMGAMLAAVDDSHLASLVLLTAPLGFEDDGLLSAWSRAPFFDAESFAELFGHVPNWITQPSFMTLRPLGQPAKLLRLYQNLGSERFLDFFRALETWVNDNVPLPKAFFVDLITQLYRENALLEGGLVLGGKAVRLEAVRVPVLTIAASEDHIVPLSSALVGHERFSSEDKKAVTLQGGHIGIVVGGRVRRELVAHTTELFDRHSEELAS